MKLYIIGIALALLLSPYAWADEDQTEDLNWGGLSVTLYIHHDPNSGLAKLGAPSGQGKLVSCQTFLETSTGQVETIYGGNCVVDNQGKKSTVQVCGDTGVGEYGFSPVKPSEATKESLIAFMEKHCPGG